MKRIFKYKVRAEETFKIDLPASAEVLSVQVQRGKPMLWCLLDDEEERVPREFVVCGTGKEAKVDGCLFVGTFQLPEYELVFHLFERLP